jgi:hypothetical protein
MPNRRALICSTVFRAVISARACQRRRAGARGEERETRRRLRLQITANYVTTTEAYNRTQRGPLV